MDELSAVYVPIALVLIEDFSDRLEALARQMPVWILSTEANVAAMERVRKAISTADITNMSIFEDETPSGLLARGLVNIDDHHGHGARVDARYNAIVVYGGTIGELSPDLIAELGLRDIKATGGGFTASISRNQ